MNDSESNTRTLRAALRAVARDDESMNASPAVEARLLDEVRSIGRARRRRMRAMWLAAAAAIVAAVLVPVWRTAKQTPAGTTPGGSDQAAAATEISTDFFPLAFGNVPAPDGHLVRLQVPRTALATFGVASFGSAGDVSSTVLADVVVGNDGLARAVRFVRMARDDERQEQQR